MLISKEVTPHPSKSNTDQTTKFLLNLFLLSFCLCIPFSPPFPGDSFPFLPGCTLTLALPQVFPLFLHLSQSFVSSISSPLSHFVLIISPSLFLSSFPSPLALLFPYLLFFSPYVIVPSLSSPFLIFQSMFISFDYSSLYVSCSLLFSVIFFLSPYYSLIHSFCLYPLCTINLPLVTFINHLIYSLYLFFKLFLFPSSFSVPSLVLLLYFLSLFLFPTPFYLSTYFSFPLIVFLIQTKEVIFIHTLSVKNSYIT